VKEALSRLLATEDGKELVAFLWKESGYAELSRVIDPRSGDILNAASSYNEGRRSLYLTLRRLADPVALLPVEMEAEKMIRAVPRRTEEGKK
jgi:hypothetical protein